MENNTRREKAKNLRYKKPISKYINFDHIIDTLYEIQEECEEVRWYTDNDNDLLIDALDGDEDDAYEFKMTFADLCAECEKMLEDVSFYFQIEHFKDVFNTLFAAVEDPDNLFGWDSYEKDYLGIDYPDIAKDEAYKKLLRLTKQSLVEYAGVSYKILMGFVGLENRYDNLKASMDILKAKNDGHIQTIKKIEELYNKIDFRVYTRNSEDFDRFCSQVPQEMWL